jgi:excisionase family DNA binding protein
MLLTIQQVCERYQVSRGVVQAWVDSGDMVAINIGAGKNRRLRFSPDELDRFDRGRATKPAPVISTPDLPQNSYV